MIDDGDGYATALVLQYLLRKLENKGILNYKETQKMLDDAMDELKDAASRMVISPDEAATASRRIGMMYLPVTTPSQREARRTIDLGGLNASNDE